jgi:hypothetical protein
MYLLDLWCPRGDTLRLEDRTLALMGTEVRCPSCGAAMELRGLRHGVASAHDGAGADGVNPELDATAAVCYEAHCNLTGDQTSPDWGRLTAAQREAWRRVVEIARGER